MITYMRSSSVFFHGGRPVRPRPHGGIVTPPPSPWRVCRSGPSCRKTLESKPGRRSLHGLGPPNPAHQSGRPAGAYRACARAEAVVCIWFPAPKSRLQGRSHHSCGGWERLSRANRVDNRRPPSNTPSRDITLSFSLSLK